MRLQGYFICWKRMRSFPSRCIHTSSHLWKKKYDFNLDNVIRFKAETASVFGSPRKPTKTGKLKKLSKPLDKKIQGNLETLSAISNSKEIRSQFDSSIRSQKDNASRQGDSKKKEVVNDFEIPDEVLMLNFPPGDAYPVNNSYDDFYIEENRSSSLKKSNFDQSNERRGKQAIYDLNLNSNFKQSDEVFMPDLPPASTALFKEISKDTFVRQRKTRAPAGQREDESLEIKNNEAPSSQKKRLKSQSSKVATPIHDEYADGELDIPKITPVPVSSSSHKRQQQTLNLHPPFPQKREDGAKPVPLFEPPASFDVISKFPLIPGESENIDANQTQNLKNDINQLSLRYPPSVKSILNKTMAPLNRFFLNRWREQMIRELGEEGFKQHQDATIKRGINLHANIMEFLSGKPVEEIQIMPDNKGHWESLQSVINTVSDVRALEVEVMHQDLMYRGVFDCLARYKDLLCLIDWKVSKKPRPLLKNTYDDPVQVAAYAGAVNSDQRYTVKFGEINHGMIVVVYPDGSPAHIHILNKALLNQFWQDWTNRLHEYLSLVYTEKQAQRVQD